MFEESEFNDENLNCFSKKIVSIDYDETFSLNPILFIKIIKLFQKANFEVICCTLRNIKYKEAGFTLLEKENVKCYFTSGKGKLLFLKEKGINVDIWIDDDPSSITEIGRG